MDVSAVIVTRGNVDLGPILNSLPFADVVVWDNSVRNDLSVYGRYAGIEETRHDLVYVQDDDAICPAQGLLDAYQGGVLCNMDPQRPGYSQHALVGWGALFPAAAPFEAFDKYLGVYPDDAVFRRCCDIVFTALSPYQLVDLGHEDLGWATHPDRMYHQPHHTPERDEVLRRCLSL